MRRNRLDRVVTAVAAVVFMAGVVIGQFLSA